MRLSCWHLRVMRSHVSSLGFRLLEILEEGVAGATFCQGHRGVCALSPSSPASSGYRRETRHRGEVAPSWGARPRARTQDGE